MYRPSSLFSIRAVCTPVGEKLVCDRLPVMDPVIRPRISLRRLRV